MEEWSVIRQSSRLRIGKKLTKKPTPGKDEQMLRVKGLLSFQFGKLLMIPFPLDDGCD